MTFFFRHVRRRCRRLLPLFDLAFMYLLLYRYWNIEEGRNGAQTRFMIRA